MLPGKTYGVQDYVAVAQRYWWLVAASTAIGLFAALLVSASQKDVYQSEMLVQIVPQRVPDRFVPSTITARTEDRMDSLEAQVKSRSQLERLIREFDLYRDEQARMPMEDVVAIMRNAIKVDLIRPARNMPADAFNLKFTYGNPDLAARVTTALGNLFIAQNARERGELADSTNGFLEIQLAEAKVRLEEQERKVKQFRQKFAGRLPTQSDFNLQAIQTNQSQLQALVESVARDRDRRMLLERLYNDAVAEPVPTPAGATAAAAAADPAAASAIPAAQQLVAARAVLARLAGRLTAEHPDVRRQQRLITDLEKKAAEEGSPASLTNGSATADASPQALQRREKLRTMKAEIDSLDRQMAFKETEERRLRARVAEYAGRLEAIPGVESDWISLTRDYETLQESYANLLRKSEDAKVAANLEKQQGGEQFKIVESARVPARPVNAVRLQTNAIGTGLGLALGVCFVAFLFIRDTSFHTEADVLEVLALPVLATVPFVVDKAEVIRRRRLRLIVGSVVAVVSVSAGCVAWVMQLWKYVT
jgi:polysaccharide chain length determinant protein (PEP-CTERM system associated)